MATTNNNNQPANNENISPSSQNSTSLNEPSHDASSDNPRRSTRLSEQSPHVNRRLINTTNIHRTVCGGVASSHSPKLNIRRRTSINAGCGDSDRANTTSHIVLSHHGTIRNEDNSMDTQNSDLPSDQSADEETVTVDNNDNSTIVLSKTPRVASRQHVMGYFDTQPDGYRCKLCTRVSCLQMFLCMKIVIRVSIKEVKIPMMYF